MGFVEHHQIPARCIQKAFDACRALQGVYAGNQQVMLGEGVGLHHPTESTIYINFKTSYSRSSPAKGYDGLIFDYFITGGTVSLNPVTIQSGYSDHNPVSSTIEL
jgi:hypothetical protein